MADVMIPTWTVGDRLVKARKLADLKQSDMAEHLGMSRGAVSAWENDETPIKAGMLRSWAAKCNETSEIPISYEWLRFGSPSADGGSVSDEPWSACTPRAAAQEELPFGETIEVPEPDHVVVPFRRAS